MRRDRQTFNIRPDMPRAEQLSLLMLIIHSLVTSYERNDELLCNLVIYNKETDK